ncbi:MAG: alpha/beta fold hydrolase [Gammaproteobacteria bacterium]|jgi:pimeloyl-ACP methyl ester carboxylesterase
MGTLPANGVRLHYREAGEGPETIVFSHSYLLSGEHFAPQISALARRYRCLAFDHRGHGASEAPASGYDMENLYADAVAFIEAVRCAPCHFVGLSTGGFIGLRLGIRRPDLVRSLILMDTSADAEPGHRARQYRMMLPILKYVGYWPLRRRIASMFFSPHFRRDAARRSDFEYWKGRTTANDRQAMVRFGRGILERASVAGELGDIAVPTLVIVGENDIPTPVEEARRMAGGIPGARLEIIPAAGHVCTVEQPDKVTDLIAGFLEEVRSA